MGIIIPKKGISGLNLDAFRERLSEAETLSNPVDWQETQLGVSLCSNQIEITERYFDSKVRGYNILGSRGSGKTQGQAWAMAAKCSMRPNTHIICAAPIEKQAGRLIKYVKSAMISEKSKVRKMLDLSGSSALRLVWKNGSTIVAVSGQEKASVEGEHGTDLVVDEAHLVPSYSFTNKLTPMIQSIGGVPTKIVKMGVSMGKGHFYKTVMARNAVNCICKWNQAEVFLTEPDPIFYKGVQYSLTMVSRMPVEYKRLYFPNRPDLHEPSGYEVTLLDWRTQYEMEWVDDINSALSDEQQEMLAAGTHGILIRGMAKERYFAGLDTAQGSLTGRTGTDSTVLAIWRLRRSGELERVASYHWQGSPLDQEEEIWEICNPRNGLFKCEMVFADYSNIAISMVERFRKSGMAIVGCVFGGSAKSVGSAKNWKNTLFDHFTIQLDSEMCKYPNLVKLKQDIVSANEDERTQIENALEGHWQWCQLQRKRGKGLNDKIEAPTDTVEDEYGSSSVAHDDAVCADMLAVWAAKHPEQLRKEMSKNGGLVGYEIPIPVIGVAYSSSISPVGGMGGVGRSSSTNPIAAQKSAVSDGGLVESGVEPGYLGGLIGLNMKK